MLDSCMQGAGVSVLRCVPISFGPGAFSFVEVWSKDYAWFEEHQLSKDYYNVYRTKTEPMLIERKLSVLSRMKGWSFIDQRFVEESVQDKGRL